MIRRIITWTAAAATGIGALFVLFAIIVLILPTDPANGLNGLGPLAFGFVGVLLLLGGGFAWFFSLIL